VLTHPDGARGGAAGTRREGAPAAGGESVRIQSGSGGLETDLVVQSPTFPIGLGGTRERCALCRLGYFLCRSILSASLLRYHVFRVRFALLVVFSFSWSFSFSSAAISRLK
jgi:hypothetical protein